MQSTIENKLMWIYRTLNGFNQFSVCDSQKNYWRELAIPLEYLVAQYQRHEPWKCLIFSLNGILDEDLKKKRVQLKHCSLLINHTIARNNDWWKDVHSQRNDLDLFLIICVWIENWSVALFITYQSAKSTTLNTATKCAENCISRLFLNVFMSSVTRTVSSSKTRANLITLYTNKSRQESGKWMRKCGNNRCNVPVTCERNHSKRNGLI